MITPTESWPTKPEIPRTIKWINIYFIYCEQQSQAANPPPSCPSTPPHSCFIVNLFFFLILYLFWRTTTQTGSPWISPTFLEGENPSNWVRHRKLSQIIVCCSRHQTTSMLFTQQINWVLTFDIRYKSNVEISTDWVICHIKLGAFTPFWKGLISHIHLFLKSHRMNNNKIACSCCDL